MEYLVLARKWRPQTFDEIVGQRHVVTTLKNAITQGRIAHAFVFSGPRGIGKTSVARIMAKALCCETGPTVSPCQVCTACREITEGVAMDIQEIDGASNRGIDEIRELRENVKFLPVSRRYKIYIIDEVHMLTREAFNALLKTLEEPPPHVIFIFATTETQKIPPTILSRCQCYDFRRLSVRQIADQLQKISQAESIQISENSLIWIAEAADGGMRDAQSLLDQVISYGGAIIDDQTVEELLGLSDRQFLFRISQAILERTAADGLYIVEEAYYAGVEMTSFYQMLQVHFRNLLLVKIADPKRTLTDISEQDVKRLREQVENVSRETLLRLLDVLMVEEEKVRRSQNPRLNIEQAVIRMAHMPPLIPIDDILDKIEELRGKISAMRTLPKDAVIREEQTVLPRGAAPDTPSFQEEQPPGKNSEKPLPARKDASPLQSTNDETPARLWAAFLSYVKDFSYPLWSKIESAQVLDCTDGSLQIGFHKGYIFLDELKKQDQATSLNTLCSQCFGGKITGLHIREIEDNGKITEENQQNTRQEIRREALNQPLLQTVLDVFEGASVARVLPLGGEQDSFIRDTEKKNI
jgi:DNA polymerase-3 subunit gamma/tau